MSFIFGFAIGVAMVIFIGPVLFTVLNGAITYGFKGGFSVANGIIVSDIVCVLLCYYGASRFLDAEAYLPAIALIGAFLLLGMGLNYILKGKAIMKELIRPPKKNSSLFVQGFLVNFVNPFVFIVWIGLIAFGQEKYGDGPSLFSFLTASLLGIYLTDILKAYYASKLIKLLSTRGLSRINIGLGILLIVFSLRLFWYAWSTF